MSALDALTAAGFRLRFERLADRYAQVVEVHSGRDWVSVARSIESAGDEPWPASPPLQDLHIERRDAGAHVALLVGRAGRSHWSLSVEIDADQRLLQFDVACRSSDTPGWLGSSYQLLTDNILVCDFVDGAEAIVTAGRLTFAARHSTAGNPTIRWRYRLMVERPAGMV